jgi:hypothetical protein
MVESRHFIVDGMLSGTGVRDGINGGYIEIDDLALPEKLSRRIQKWHSAYEKLHFRNYKDHSQINKLDNEGKDIVVELQGLFQGDKVSYYSSALMKLIET